jgi:transposase InsO family protein
VIDAGWTFNQVMVFVATAESSSPDKTRSNMGHQTLYEGLAFVWVRVTANARAEGIARQLTEACGWEAPPDYVVRDRDCVYGEAYVQRLRAMCIRDRPTAPRLPWQNAYAERPIGSIRREVLDHTVLLGERRLRHLLHRA